MRKKDKIEMHITFQAMRITFLYTSIFLLIWISYDFIKFRELGLPMILVLSQGAILFGSELFLKWKMNKDEK